MDGFDILRLRGQALAGVRSLGSEASLNLVFEHTLRLVGSYPITPTIWLPWASICALVVLLRYAVDVQSPHAGLASIGNLSPLRFPGVV